MVLESLTSVQNAEKKPIEMLPLAFIYSSIAIILSLWIFPDYASFAMVTFIIIACMPLMAQILYFEKDKQEKSKKEFAMILHEKTISLFIFLFLGMVFAFVVWFILLPAETANNAFFLQINTITRINAPAMGNIVFGGDFAKILINNLKILGLCILFSIFYGTGAIFILAWNASVTGVAIASSIRLAIGAAAGAAGAAGIANYFGAFSFGVLRYLVHGIPEILGYFIGGLAGGIISVAIIRRQFGTEKFTSSMFDSLGLIATAAFLLIIGAVLEIFISPLVPI